MKKTWEQMSVSELEAEVRRHNRLYFVDNAPEISDTEFDMLVEILRAKAPESPALTEIVSDARPQSSKIKHDIPLLSLDKCYDKTGIAEWASKFDGDLLVSPKIDGLAVSLKYNKFGSLFRAVTRGDGFEGEDITRNAKVIDDIPKKLLITDGMDIKTSFEVRGEIFMPLSVFEKSKDLFANPRNLASGAARQKNSSKTKEAKLSFFAYALLGPELRTEEDRMTVLEQMGFKAVKDWQKVSRKKSQEAYEYFLSHREGYDFETDGVVFKANLVSEQERLGSTTHHPKYAIAYKFQGESDRTELLDVDWSVARSGAITPIAIVKPVQLSGAMVRRASLHNLGMLKELIGKGLTIGARVVMTRRGGVIPHLESVDQKGTRHIVIPKVCPSCGGQVEIREDFLYCTNVKSCVQSKVGELEHFVKTIGIDGFGEKLIAKLYESGMVTDPAEFYELTAEELLELERMGETLAAKLVANIDAHRSIPLAAFLQSLGIRELGRHAAKILAGMGPLEKVRKLTEEELACVHTIGPVIAAEVVSGLKAKRALIEKLLKQIQVEAEAEKAGGRLGGRSFLFTGKMLSLERSEAQQLVEQEGGVAALSVNKDLDYLVKGAGGGAGSKLGKAKKLAASGGKVKVIEEKEFLRMVK